MKKLFIQFLMVLSSMVLLISCNEDDDSQPELKAQLQIYRGTPVDLGNGKATAWISVNHLGAPVELGLEMTREALYNLPETLFSVDAVPLPDKAKELTPFEHIQIDWMAMGHGMASPNGPAFIGPHYDIRFFMTTLDERQTIPAPTDVSAKYDVHPPEGYMPAGSGPSRTTLASIGRLWFDGSVFLTGMQMAMLFGAYNGKYTFISPIVTIEELQSGNRTSRSFNQPQHFQESNTYYPTRFNIYAEDSKKEKEHVTLSEFVLR